MIFNFTKQSFKLLKEVFNAFKISKKYSKCRPILVSFMNRLLCFIRGEEIDLISVTFQYTF